MPIRLSGMASGLDTDTIIKGMMDAQRLKDKRVSDKSQVLEWKQERLKEINTKLYKLYSEDLTKLRLQSGYSTKKVTSTNESIVSVTGKNSATTGTHSIDVKALASAQYVTGEAIKNSNGQSKLVGDLKMAAGTVITITTATGSKDITIDSSTTLDSFSSKLKSAGINASYDNAQKRFFFSSKESGADSWFTISANVKNANLGGIGNDTLNDAEKDVLKNANKVDLDNVIDAIKNDKAVDGFNKELVDVVKKIYEKNITQITATANLAATKTVKEELTAAIKKEENYGIIDVSGLKENIKTSVLADLRVKYPDDSTLTDEEFNNKHTKEFDSLVDKGITSKVEELMKGSDIQGIISTKQEEYETLAKTSLGDDIKTFATTNTTSSEQLSKLGLSEITSTTDTNGKVTVSSTNANIKIVNANSSEVLYNGATLTGNTNTIAVNGLTLELKGLSNGQPINISVIKDTQATYDSIKNFVTNYNSILKELNTLYYANSSRGFDPLSDEEKESMTDDQITKWEGKIKNSVIRRDSTVGNLISAMKSALLTPITASDGKTYSLASFGIGTSSDYTEKGLLHINGDKDDATFAALTNKLMEALESDPDIVADVMSKTVKNLYDAVDTKIKAIPNVRSAFTFYNDKLMTNQQTEYKKKITILEKKLNEMENKYYKQFSAMETAMAKLQSQTNALSGMFGNNGGN